VLGGCEVTEGGVLRLGWGVVVGWGAGCVRGVGRSVVTGRVIAWMNWHGVSKDCLGAECVGGIAISVVVLLCRCS